MAPLVVTAAWGWAAAHEVAVDDDIMERVEPS
jgi:hypothetical protein